MVYSARFEPADEGGFVITFPDFGWGVSQGDSETEAQEMAAALLQTLVQEHIRKGEALPRPSKPRTSRQVGSQFRAIRLPALPAVKAEFYAAFRASGLSKAQLATRLGIPRPNVERLFDLSHRSRLDHIEAAFRALGKEIDIQVRDAA
jgi:antitoxin HicB